MHLVTKFVYAKKTKSQVLPPASHKRKLFAEIFSENSNLQDWGISLPTLLSRSYWGRYLGLKPTAVSLSIIRRIICLLTNSRYSIFSDFQHGSRSSSSTEGLVRGAHDRIAKFLTGVALLEM